METPEVVIPAPWPQQVEPLAAAKRFKIWRWGRRDGKTRGMFIAGTVGHGPPMADGQPKFRGISQGADIIWIARDYPQSRAIWREEILPRFKHVEAAGLCELNETERRLVLPNGGQLEIRSAEAIDSLRGRGPDGILLDEPAWWDLRYAWSEVLRPALIDSGGWAIFGSTPNAGLDGNQDKVVPSYFNVLCQKCMDEELDPRDWGHWHHRTRDNPKLPKHEIDAIYAEYPVDSPIVQQELDALLIQSGTGLAFSEWRDELHVPMIHGRGMEPPTHWTWFAGLDWGYRSSGALVLCAAGPDEEICVRWDWVFKEINAYRAGYQAGQYLKQFPLPVFVAYDSATDNQQGVITPFDEWRRGLKDVLKDYAPALYPSVKEGRGGKTYRQTRAGVLHHFLHWTPPTSNDIPLSSLEPWQRPKLWFHPEAKGCIQSIPRLPIDPKDLEDVDTTAFDHPYDALGYALMAHIPRPDDDRRMEEPHKHIFTGIDPETGQRYPRIWERAQQEVPRFRTAVNRYKRG